MRGELSEIEGLEESFGARVSSADDGDPSLGEMGVEERVEDASALLVERRPRLVEQPDRTRGENESREGESFSLSLGELGASPRREAAESEDVEFSSQGAPRERLVSVVGEESAMPCARFDRREKRVERIAGGDPMTETGSSLSEGLGVRSAHAQRASRRLGESGEDAQQRRLSRSVVADERKDPTRRNRERHSLGDRTLSALEGEVFGFEARLGVLSDVHRRRKRTIGDDRGEDSKTARAPRMMYILPRDEKLAPPRRWSPDTAMPADPSRAPRSLDSFGVLRSMGVGSKRRSYYSLRRLGERLDADVSRLPFSLRILLENLLRFEDGRSVTRKDIESLARWRPRGRASREISFRPARVLMQDFTGVPAMVDLAAMREKFVAEGGDADRVAPRIPVDLVIDHSVSVDVFARRDALRLNVAEEYRRNAERYSFLKWGAEAFANFRVVPPGAGICHQVNLERLGEVVREARFEKAEDKNKGKGKGKGKRSAPEPPLLFPDTLVGTDSHTTMINGLATLGWGTGGIEAEAGDARTADFDVDSRSDRISRRGTPSRRRDVDGLGVEGHRDASR